MSSLRDIRHKLRSIQNIKKITDTMERIAAVRLHSAQLKAEQSRPYTRKLKEILENIAIMNSVSHPLFEERIPKKIGVMIVSADRGLSGPYNENIFKAADRFLNQFSPDQLQLILLGRKAIDYYKQKEFAIRSQMLHWSEQRKFNQIILFTQELVQAFLSRELDVIWLIYTHYVSLIRRDVIIEKFLNIGIPNVPSSGQITPLNYIFEPSLQEILDETLPRYCNTKIQTALYEAYASELAARIIAMQTASKNSEEMIDRLTLVKNKIRQASITREMIEITSGAEGLK